jgi:hypothetical protein
MTTKRDYKKEYRDYHGKPEQIAAKTQRNAARAKLGLSVGDKRECDHKNPISNGGSNRKDNLRAVARAQTARRGRMIDISGPISFLTCATQNYFV